MKNHSYFMQAVCILLWIDSFETYMVAAYPLDRCYHEKKARKFQFNNMGPLIRRWLVVNYHSTGVHLNITTDKLMRFYSIHATSKYDPLILYIVTFSSVFTI